MSRAKSYKCIILGTLLAAILAWPGAAPTHAQQANIADFLFDDVDDSNTRSCGDIINFILTFGEENNPETQVDFFENVTIEIPIPSNVSLLDDKIVATNPNDDPVILSGTQAADTRILVDLGTTCENPQLCGPTGGALQFLLRIRDPNPFTSFSIQGTVSGSNFDSFVTNHLGDNTPNSPAIVEYDPCPATRLFPEIFKHDQLAEDADRDSRADPGDVILYTTHVQNNQSLDAEDVLLEIPAHPHLELLAGTVQTSQGVVDVGNGAGHTSIRVNLGTLAGRTAATITHRSRIVSPLDSSVTEVACQGSLRGSNVPLKLSDDPDTVALGDPTRTPVDHTGFAEPVIIVEKAVVPELSDARPGGLLVWDLVVTNTGTRDSDPVVVADLLPLHSTFVAGQSSAGWDCRAEAAGIACIQEIGSLAIGESTTLRIAARIVDPLPAGIEAVENCAGALFSGATPETAPETCVSTPVDARPDLALSKTDDDVTARPGEVITYRLTYSNVGDQTATGVEIVETIPEHTTVALASSDPGWSCEGAVAGQICRLAVGSLAAQASGVVDFAVRVEETFPPGPIDAVFNEAVISDDGANGAEPDLTNNRATETTPLEGLGPRLTIRKLAPATSPGLGEILTWTVEVTNQGNQAAEQVVVLETVPAHTTFEASASDPRWGCRGAQPGSQCRLDAGLLDAGSSDSATFAVRLPQVLPAGIGAVENCLILDDPHGPTGGGPAETCSSVPLPDAVPDLVLTKTDADAVARSGEVVLYTLSFENIGSQGATGVVLEDHLPPRLTPDLAASSNAWSCQPEPTGQVCRLDLGSVEAGASGTVVLAVQVAGELPEALGSFFNQAEISDDGANGADANPTDNRAEEETPVERPEPPPPTEPPALEATLTDLLVFDPDGDGAGAGDRVAYVLQVENVGEELALGVRVEVSPDPLSALIPETLDAHGAQVLAGNALGETTVEVLVGDLAPGSFHDLVFEVEVITPVPQNAMELVVQGTALASNAPSEATNDPETPADDDPTRTPLVVGSSGEPFPIPTVSEWGLILLALLLAGFTLGTLRRANPAPRQGGWS